MATQVVKKDGSKQPFDSEKIKRAVEGAAQEAGLPDDKVLQIATEVSGIVAEWANAQEQVATSEIKSMILNELDKVEPSVSAAWRAYEASKA
jgi:transcriptional regulator NrdR family protein